MRKVTALWYELFSIFVIILYIFVSMFRSIREQNFTEVTGSIFMVTFYNIRGIFETTEKLHGKQSIWFYFVLVTSFV
jgi:hypothetical protein